MSRQLARQSPRLRCAVSPIIRPRSPAAAPEPGAQDPRPAPGDLIAFGHGGGKGHVDHDGPDYTIIGGDTSREGKSRDSLCVFEHVYPAETKSPGNIRVR